MPARIHLTDTLAGRHEVTRQEIGAKGFESRHQTVGVLDGQEGAVHDRSSEGDDTVCRGDDGGGDGCAEINTAMTGAILVCWRTKGSRYCADPAQRPEPTRGVEARRGTDRRTGRADHCECDDECEEGAERRSRDCAHGRILIGCSLREAKVLPRRTLRAHKSCRAAEVQGECAA